MLADAVVLVHFAFIAFVVLGALLCLRWTWIAALHLPALAWGVYIELSGGVCPLTPLENELRREAGQAGYAGSFVEQYMTPVIYPADLTAETQVGLGFALLGINIALYTWVWRRHRMARVSHNTPSGASHARLTR